MGNVGVIRERGRTADDRVIKAELHPPHRAGHRATVCPSSYWASKNWPLLSHPYAQASRHASVLMLRRVHQCWWLDKTPFTLHTMAMLWSSTWISTATFTYTVSSSVDRCNMPHKSICAGMLCCIALRRQCNKLRLVAYNFSICSVLVRDTALYIASCGRTSPYVHTRACTMRRRKAPYAVWTGLKDTNDSDTSIQMTVLEIIIAVLHRLPIGRHAGHHA